MSYQRLYPQRINWEDEPSLATPINQVNLNKMDSALYGIDGRVVELDENKVGKTETFNTSRNGVVPKPTQADITNEKVLRADGSWVEQSGGGGGGGGHTIVNNAGTSLTQRGKLKTVGGLNATDDGVNNTTEITDVVEEVPWATWQSYPSEEAALQAHPNCVVTGAPDCDGDVEIEFEKVLWTNPSPTSAFDAGQIILNSSDYTDYEIRFAQNKNSTSSRISSRTEKGKGTLLNYSAATGSGVRTFSRGVAYVDATHLSIADCTYATGTTADVTNNDNCIPIEVIGHKRKPTAKIQVIARNVSTSASKCMMSDGNSVESAINRGKVSVTADGTKTYRQLFIELWALVNISKVTNQTVFTFNYNNSAHTRYIYPLAEQSDTYLVFSRGSANSSGARIEGIQIDTTGAYLTSIGSTRTDSSTQVPSSGWSFAIEY